VIFPTPSKALGLVFHELPARTKGTKNAGKSSSLFLAMREHFAQQKQVRHSTDSNLFDSSENETVE
jgi:hypothetical protein